MDNGKYTTINRAGVGEFVRLMNKDLNPILTSPTLGTVRTHSSPLMGTYARAAKRRIDSESGPIRIEGTDTFNQPMQHIYQNSRHVTNDQASQLESRRLVDVQSDRSDDRLKFSSLNYDVPPRKEQQQPSAPPAQKIITTITTTTTTAPAKQYQSTGSLNEAPSPVDRLLEQAVELHKLNSNNPNSANEPLVIERKEQFQVFLNSADREGHPTSTNSRARSAHATDLDQAQVDRFIDDHQAIQHLTRALQEHNTTTLNEYKRLPSQTAPIVINTTTTTTRIPSSLRQADQATTSEFSVIDALLHNPLGTSNPKQNSKLQARFNNILSNLRNADYVNALKESTRKVTKKKKSKKSSNATPKGPAVDKETQITEAMIDPNLVTTEQMSLINSDEQIKRNRIVLKNGNYQVVDAVLGSPVSSRLPEAYLTKYRANPPLSQSSLAPSITGKNANIPLSQQADPKVRNETANGLVKVVNDLTLHHAAALTRSVPSTTNNLQQSIKSGYSQQISSPGSTGMANQSSEPIKPRVLYRYIDEHGNILKISPVGPSQLREIAPEESQNTLPRNTEPTYMNNRPFVVEDERHYPLHDQRSGWSNGSKTPNRISREDFELSENRSAKAPKQSSSTSRTIPISIEQEYSMRFPTTQSQGFHPSHSNQENIRTTWMPRSQKSDPLHSPTSGPADYETGSTDSEHSTSYPSHEYPEPSHRQHRSPNQQNRSPVRPYDPSPSRTAYGTRRISPDYTHVHTPRNYIEVFRDGDIKPSEIYSLPFNDSSSTSDHHSPYEQQQTSSISPTSKYAKIIPSLSSHDPRTSQHSPTRATPYHDSYPQPSKSSEYRPLRTKLHREYKITPSLLVDEWDLPETPTSPDQHKQPSLSAPDDVFMTTNRSYKA